METAKDDASASAKGHEDNEDGVFGKTVKVSIRERLQAFRCSKSTTSTVPKPSISRIAPKIQHVKCGEGEDSVTKPEDIDDEGDGILPPETFDPPLEIITVNECHSKSITESSEEESPVGHPTDQADKELKEPSSMIGLSESNVGAVSQENVIRAINREVVHQICSGQVIVTLSTAVKELVENSIDAGAKKIDIRLVENGSKLIEVSDDAIGIEETNFEGLALKHHTSKIAEFEDLGNLSTFGFRGEALSSLCALANLTVITRHRDEQKSGFKIEYDYKGHIKSKVRCARDFGTTIILKDLFHTLPVRHKEFNKNLKKEYHRMVNVLYGYCLVVDGLRIMCTNQTGNGGPQKVIAVPAYNSMKEKIAALFGSKQLMALVEIKQEDVSEEILEEFGLSEKTFERKYEVEGYISKPNLGRSSSDRQFYFINCRPCDPVKINRVVNEVYHTFSRQQNPFVCLHIKTNRENVDVNVTPDKRTLYVQNEKILLATIKASLVPVLTAAASSFNPVNITQSQLSSFTFSGNSQQSVENSSALCVSSSFEIQPEQRDNENPEEDDRNRGFDPQFSTNNGKFSTSNSTSFTKRFGRDSSSNETSRSSSSYSGYSFKRLRESGTEGNKGGSKQSKFSGYLRRFDVTEKTFDDGSTSSKHYTQEDISNDPDEMEVDVQQLEDVEMASENSSIACNTLEEDVEVLYDDDLDCNDKPVISQGKSVAVSVDWKNVRLKLASANLGNSSSVNYARRFRAKISPEDNKTAEDELKKQLTQEMFSKMDIVGQFNLGFIVVKNGPDLFIVDQHASDEKYNYEQQEKSTVLQGQLLIHPLEMELTAISENIIIDNIEIFQKNGFDFIISPDEEPQKRIRMLKIPYSKNVEFGKPDVEELIFMLEDASTEKCFYRPTKVRQMFASRACRKSVMIGTALSYKEMRDIVDHMGEMDQPWNCPHGRPTIRHLINLNLLPDLDLTKFNH